MKYVLRSQLNGRYLKRSGVWVPRLDDAITFSDAGEAREFCQAHHIENVQLMQCPMPYLMTLLAGATSPSAGA